MMKKILIILFTIAAFVIAGLFMLGRPYEKLHEQRVGVNQVNVLVEFVNVTGDSNCAKLYIIESDSNLAKGMAIFPATPVNIPVPDDGEYAYDGNVFKLTGYPYEWVVLNSISGDERREISQRFDVVKWEIIAPYTIWSGQEGEDGEPLTEKRSIPLAYEFTADDKQPALFKMNNYINCLAD